MPTVTIPNLSEDTHRALQDRAASNGTSTEAEICSILDEAVISKPQLKLGDALVEFGQRWGGLDDVDFSRDKVPARSVDFGE